jgi:hypothetical protein
MSYRLKYPGSVGVDAPTKPSLYNLLGLNQLLQIKKKEEGLPSWVLWAGGAVALAALLGAGALVVRKRKAKP